MRQDPGAAVVPKNVFEIGALRFRGTVERRKFFSDGLKGLAKDFYNTPIGEYFDRRLHGLANMLDPRGLDHVMREHGLGGSDDDSAAPAPGARPDDRNFARPPGALPDPQAFRDACTRCGDCIIACPHGAIFRQGLESGPVLDPNLAACRLCPDTPCITACGDGALLPLPGNSLPKFGQAELIDGRCRNESAQEKSSRGSKSGRKMDRKASYCRECQRACPVSGVITYDRKTKLPRFDPDICTGCGLCVQACPEVPAAIEVRI